MSSTNLYTNIIYPKSKRHYVFDSRLPAHFKRNTKDFSELGTLHMVTPSANEQVVEDLERDNLLGYFTYIEGMNENGHFIFDVDQENYIDITKYNVEKTEEE